MAFLGELAAACDMYIDTIERPYGVTWVISIGAYPPFHLKATRSKLWLCEAV